MVPRLVVTLIHGTYAPDAPWTMEGSPLRNVLERAFGDQLRIERFRWSGGNSNSDRLSASLELQEHIKHIRAKDLGSRQVLIAHSHGGNVACYALANLLGDHDVIGLACLATPFLHGRVRDRSAFKANHWRDAVFGIIMLLLWASGTTGRHGWPWFFGATFIAIVTGTLIGAMLEGWLDGLSRSTWRIADLITATVPSEIDLLILRAVGDEASLALGTAEFLSWITTKAFVHYAEAREGQFAGLKFKHRPLPRAIVLLWCLGLALLLISGVLGAYRPDLSRAIAPPVLSFIAFLMLSTAVCKTFWFDHLLYGIVLVAVTLATFLGIASVGTLPEIPEAGRISRWIVGWVYALLVETYVEPIPAGTRKLTLFDRNPATIGKLKGELTHSIYLDSRAVARVAVWLEGLIEGRHLPSWP